MSAITILLAVFLVFFVALDKSIHAACPSDATLSKCASSCAPSCRNPIPDASCTEKACACDNDYVRSASGQCIPRSDCTYTYTFHHRNHSLNIFLIHFNFSQVKQNAVKPIMRCIESAAPTSIVLQFIRLALKIAKSMLDAIVPMNISVPTLIIALVSIQAIAY